FDKTEGDSGFDGCDFEVLTTALVGDPEAALNDVGGFVLRAGIPFLPIAVIPAFFDSAARVDDPVVNLTLQPKTRSLLKFCAIRKIDLSAGIRPLVPRGGPPISLKASMGL